MAGLKELESKLNKLMEERKRDQETIENLRADLKSFKRESDPTTQIYEVLQDKKRSPAEELLIHDVEKAAKAAINARIKLITRVLGIPGLVIGISILATAKTAVESSLLKDIEDKIGAKVIAHETEIKQIIDEEKANLEKTEDAVKEANNAQDKARKKISDEVLEARLAVASLKARTGSLDEFITSTRNKTTREFSSIQTQRERARKDLDYLNTRTAKIRDLISKLDKQGVEAQAVKDALIKDGAIDEIEKIARSACPVGTVVAWAGKTAPTGWKICDGDPLKIADFEKLYKALDDGKIYGKSGDEFNLPNYQGYFLRGVSKNKEQDPDRDMRTDRQNNRVGPVVGSIQGDSIEDHNHVIRTDGSAGHKHDKGGITLAGRHDFHSKDDGNKDHGYKTDKKGGNETRPKNVYVHWIIKVK